MPNVEQRDLQRLRYRQGQMLRSQELNDQALIEDHLRWWHNRAVHNAYGVVEGFETELVNGLAVIKPGIAYDCFGRELILARDREVKLSSIEGMLPAGSTAGTVTVLMDYGLPASGVERNNLAACLSPGRSLSEPTLVYKTGQFSIRDGVPVAEFTFKKAKGVHSLTTIEVKDARPLARALARPHLASGSTSLNNTDWRLWTEPASDGNEFFIGFQVDVDTTDAGFLTPPCYFAWMPSLLSDFDEVRNASVQGFEYRFFPPWAGTINVANRPDLKELLISAVKTARLYICWIGIEHRQREELEVAQSPAFLPSPIFRSRPLTPLLRNLIIER